MDQVINSIISVQKTKEEKIHAIREFLQVLILKILHESNHFRNLAFVGGTSLRILYNMQRYSEDLDFSVIEHTCYTFNDIVKSLDFHLQKMNFSIEMKVKQDKIVQSVLIKFSNLLQQFGLSRVKDEKLAIRVEVDSNPPAGWQKEMSVLNQVYIFPVWHFDLPSLFATKLHDCFYRQYRKGRDYYDLMWYLSKKVIPNFKLLNKAILQTEDNNENINDTNFKDFILAHIKQVNFPNLRNDVRPFLITKSEADMIEKDVFKKLLSNY
jgi:predicted nucleotidyltransferase component of viral defense system